MHDFPQETQVWGWRQRENSPARSWGSAVLLTRVVFGETTLIEGFRHVLCGTICRSRRDLTIRAVGNRFHDIRVPRCGLGKGRP